MRPRWVDFHCHLDLYSDHTELIAECDREQIATLAVTTTPKAWRRNRQLAQESKFVRVALGLHPQLIAERAEELTLFEEFLPEARYVGEIGLDAGPGFYGSFRMQEHVFTRILSACAEQGGKILTIHSVRAVSKVLTHLEEYLPPERGRAILHWFSGTPSEARRAADLGCYFSINAEMLRTERHKRLVAALPRNRLLTETDGPFVSFGERPARPRDVQQTAALLAEVLQLSDAATRDLILGNLADLASGLGDSGGQPTPTQRT